jgi:flagellar biosynthesis/type III secretory pathway chaperone
MHTPVTEHDTDLLAALVAAKLKILELLAQLARKQLALADRGASADLLKLLAAKQTVLGQLQQVERRLDSFRSQDPETRVWRSFADRQRCQQQANHCDELLAETMRVEKQGEAAMIRRRDQAATVLAGAAAAADAQAAYTGPALAPPVALHLHCEG